MTSIPGTSRASFAASADPMCATTTMMSACVCSSERNGCTCVAGLNWRPATLVALTIVLPCGFVMPRMPTFARPVSLITYGLRYEGSFPVFVSTTLVARNGNDASFARCARTSWPQSKSWLPTAIASYFMRVIAFVTSSPLFAFEMNVPCHASHAIPSARAIAAIRRRTCIDASGTGLSKRERLTRCMVVPSHLRALHTEDKEAITDLGPITVAPPGERRSGYFTFTRDPALAKYSWPFFSITGRREGPTFLITAGFHAAEHTGIDAAMRLGRMLDPGQLRGRLLIIPVLNRPGFYERSIYVNPEDNDNMNR